MSHYADILLPLAQPAYTFAVPEGLPLQVGQAVAVQFGPRKIYTGIVWRLHDQRPDFPRIKTIQQLLYEKPLLSPGQMALWEWIASYYLCSLGEVMRVALPSLIKPSADDEERFAQGLYRPRTELYLSLAEKLREEAHFHALCEKLERRAPKQYEALLEVASQGEEHRIATGEVARRLLRADYAPLKALIKKGYLLAEEHERSVERGTSHFLLPRLSAHQQEALTTIQRHFAEGQRSVLLQGITGSGKTEIYIHLIAETLARGGGVLLLVPEIALTAQLIERMERIFGSRVTPYHSKLTPQRRTESYLRLNQSAGGEFVVGVRSALFLPIHNLQLVIVDEEHDASYKQAEPAPRYHARDCAVMMAHQTGARVVLGSATPSLESWLNAESGKYGRAELRERYGEAVPPQIYLSDTLRAARRGERKAPFNKLLIDKIEATLARGEQVMLFQNRRGFSPYMECTQCGWTARCPACNVALTYHKQGERLICHYCGHTTPAIKRCPQCKVTEMVPMGFGTEKIEEVLHELFPTARVARLDRDSVTSERAYTALIEAFSSRQIDILVGTQMITKGFDFEGVSLVGVLNADNLLHNPDFRASERAFQLLTQVAGRSGRRSKGGEVVIQTSDTTHPVLQEVLAGDFSAMARRQLKEREQFNYPPYVRLISLQLRHKDSQRLERGVVALATALRQRFGRRLLGPIAPPIDRVRGEWIVGLLLKIEGGASFKRARALVMEEVKTFVENPDFRTISLTLNVDPQ